MGVSLVEYVLPFWKKCITVVVDIDFLCSSSAQCGRDTHNGFLQSMNSFWLPLDQGVELSDPSGPCVSACIESCFSQ